MEKKTSLFVIILVMICYAIICALAGWFLWLWLHKAVGMSMLGMVVFYSCYLLVCLIPVGGAFLPEGRIMHGLQGVGNVYLGFFLHFGVILMVATLLVRILVHLTHRGNGSLTAAGVLVLTLAFTAGLITYGALNAQDMKVIHYNMKVPAGPGAIEPRQLKCVLIADLHLSVNSTRSLMRTMTEKINAEDPDLVLVAGDIITSSYAAMPHKDEFRDILSSIHSKYGVYVVYGNHDVDETLFGGFPVSSHENAFRNPELTAFLQDCGWKILDDEVDNIVLEDGTTLQIVGRKDAERPGDGTKDRASVEELMLRVDKEHPILILQHEPVELEELSEAGADVAFAGHTHNGQTFPGQFVVGLFNKQAYGLRHWGNMASVVTGGAGYYGPPVRIGTCGEITVCNITLEQQTTK